LRSFCRKSAVVRNVGSNRVVVKRIGEVRGVIRTGLENTQNDEVAMKKEVLTLHLVKTGCPLILPLGVLRRWTLPPHDLRRLDDRMVPILLPLVCFHPRTIGSDT